MQWFVMCVGTSQSFSYLLVHFVHTTEYVAVCNVCWI